MCACVNERRLSSNVVVNWENSASNLQFNEVDLGVRWVGGSRLCLLRRRRVGRLSFERICYYCCCNLSVIVFGYILKTCWLSVRLFFLSLFQVHRRWPSCSRCVCAVDDSLASFSRRSAYVGVRCRRVLTLCERR